MSRRTWTALLAAPALAVVLAFFLAPLARLSGEAASGPSGWAVYGQVLSNPRYAKSLLDTVFISILVSAASVAIGGIAGLFLERHRFPLRDLTVSLLTLPISFPGVVVGFMIIMLAGRQGLLGALSSALAGHKVVFAYSSLGLFTGYLYFSIPRVVTTVMAAASKIDKTREEAAMVLGASPFRVLRDVTLPALLPALASTGAICFATCVGAFGTAFTLATDINVLPVVIYTEFTLSANVTTAAALSLVLGMVTWLILSAARLVSGTALSGGGA
jgi:putative spermidine/putrescine transport system permease protein